MRLLKISFYSIILLVSTVCNALGKSPEEKTAQTDANSTSIAIESGHSTANRFESGFTLGKPGAMSRNNTVCPAALRTNLLLDIVGGPNIGVEIPIGDRFSVAGDFAYAYTRINNRFALQTLQGSIEGRCWFRQGKNPLTGWNLGVYTTYSGRFDVQWQGGFQGDRFWSVGLSGGYSIPVSKIFNIDFSIMGGFLYSPEIRYYSRPQNGHLMWKETKYNVSRLALTQVRVSFVWLLKTN